MDNLQYNTETSSVKYVDTAAHSQFKVPTNKSGNTLTRNEISKEWNRDSEEIKENREDVPSPASRLSSAEKCVIRACSSLPLSKETLVSPHFFHPSGTSLFHDVHSSFTARMSGHIENRA